MLFAYVESSIGGGAHSDVNAVGHIGPQHLVGGGPVHGLPGQLPAAGATRRGVELQPLGHSHDGERRGAHAVGATIGHAQQRIARGGRIGGDAHHDLRVCNTPFQSDVALATIIRQLHGYGPCGIVPSGGNVVAWGQLLAAQGVG